MNPVGQVTALRRIGRNVGDLEQAQQFYANALGFEAAGPVMQDPELAALLGVEKISLLRMRLREREIELSQCFPAGAAYPRAAATQVYFQHIALLAPDIAAAWRQAIAGGGEPISRNGPVQLPAASGGVTAVKFRDPDGHPLEFLEKPGPGYDHSAISVAEVARSAAFYAGIGVALDASQRNHGPEQDALDGLDRAEVDVVTLRPPQSSPHVELLCYQNPPASPAVWQPSDLCADRLVFHTTQGLRLLRDPDGHVVLLDGRP